MYVNDPIGDMLTRVRNAIMRKHKRVQLPASKMLVSIADILKAEGFIGGYSLIETEPQKTLDIELKYVNGESAIRNLRRVSKPGIRRYIGYRHVPRIMRGLGIAILSTPKGIMTDKQAKSAKVGGEFICTIY
jgi:small subunit ribosomal protein S8